MPPRRRSTPDAIRPVTGVKKPAFMLYARPGAGKTRLVGTGPKTLIIRPPTDHTDSIRGGTAKEWVVHDWGEMYEIRDYARSVKPGEWDWIWFDSISLFQDTGLDDIWASVIAKTPHRKEYGRDKGEYGRNMERLAEWVRDMVALATDEGLFSFGVTAHPSEIADPVSGDVKLRPYVQGKDMTFKICGYMNVVAYLEVVKQKGKEVRVLRFNETDSYDAKDQFDIFPDGRLVGPTMPKLITALDKARASNRKPTRRRPTRRQKGR